MASIQVAWVVPAGLLDVLDRLWRSRGLFWLRRGAPSGSGAPLVCLPLS